MAKQAEDEQAAIQQTLGAVFYGQNKKRKRGEIVEFDDLDQQQKLYYQRRKERLQNELLDEDDEELDLIAQ